MTHQIIDKRTGVYPGNEAGTLVVFGKGRGASEWQESTDNGATFTKLGFTTMAQLEVKGKTPGKRYYYRSRKMLPNGRTGAWSPWMSGVAPD